MVQKITWLPEAQATFLTVLKYLEEQFTEKEVEKFSERIQQKLLVLKSNPRLGSKGGKKANVYKTVVHKRVILFYQYKPVKKRNPAFNILEYIAKSRENKILIGWKYLAPTQYLIIR